MSVNLGRSNIRMAQQLLHTTQIATRFKQMRSEGVPEQVGIDAQAHALAPSPVGHSGLNRTPSQALATAADEQRGFRRLCNSCSLAEPLPECVERLCPDGNDAFFLAFTS